MKIEVLESLMYSYLKHVEGCRVVQTNWKTSGNWRVLEEDKRVSESTFNNINSDDILNNVFGVGYPQLIRQAEIDVLGINNEESSVYGVEVAFHTNGLNYGGGAQETANRVVKKMLRTVLIMQRYFTGYDKYISYFITPVISNGLHNTILELVERANLIINDESIEIRFISDNEFYNEIVDPLDVVTVAEHDSYELFLRSLRLINLRVEENDVDEVEAEAAPQEDIEIISYSIDNDVDNEGRVNGMKIGQFVKHHFRRMSTINALSNEEIEEFKTLEYSNESLGLNFPLLRNVDLGIGNDNGVNRYYANKLYFGNNYLTSQWYQRHWTNLLNWLDEIGYTWRE